MLLLKVIVLIPASRMRLVSRLSSRTKCSINSDQFSKWSTRKSAAACDLSPQADIMSTKCLFAWLPCPSLQLLFVCQVIAFVFVHPGNTWINGAACLLSPENNLEHHVSFLREDGLFGLPWQDCVCLTMLSEMNPTGIRGGVKWIFPFYF